MPAKTSPIYPMDGGFGQFLYTLFRFIVSKVKKPLNDEPLGLNLRQGPPNSQVLPEIDISGQT